MLRGWSYCSPSLNLDRWVDDTRVSQEECVSLLNVAGGLRESGCSSHSSVGRSDLRGNKKPTPMWISMRLD